jgi:hypothetical protein
MSSGERRIRACFSERETHRGVLDELVDVEPAEAGPGQSALQPDRRLALLTGPGGRGGV